MWNTSKRNKKRKEGQRSDPLTFCDNAQTEGVSWGAIRAVVSSLCCETCTKSVCTNYEVPTGALDSKNAKGLMEKLKGLNEEEEATILMVTHDSNAASYCSRILFIQDGAIFHEIRRDAPEESRREFYERILKVMAQLGGGSEYVF